MEDVVNKHEESGEKEPKTEFKKPVLIGRVGKLPKKAKLEPEKATDAKNVEQKQENPEKSSSEKVDEKSTNSLPPAMLLKEVSTPIPYKEPKWSGLCPDGSGYSLEVLKSGIIVETVDLMQRPYHVFGRLANCDVVMAHPTVSRHHAIIQYKAFAEENEPTAGWYIYDLGSTHGTFLNKDKLKPNHYTRIRVGHQIKFGTSSRTYIVVGPDFDAEGESELTVTEIKERAKEMKVERDRRIQDAVEQREKDREEAERKREEQGIDWGMGEDAEEEPDLSENPYAITSNEELYLDDPKKTLRGYYEREGYELTYDCEERGVGQFLCRVELPIDDARGRPLIAEILHKGKKKEAVVACALEACRILDRAGLLRQAKHESRRRKQRDWGAEDYYDSDEDTFLDRTGAVERKRERRMRGAKGEGADDKALTYDDLLKQVSDIETKIAVEEKGLERLRSDVTSSQDPNDDSLDAFMSTLKQGHSMSRKAEISSTKMKIQNLRKELAKTQRLAEIARPAHLPPLIKKEEKGKMAAKVAGTSVVYGKRIRLKEDTERKPKAKPSIKKEEEGEFVEEMDSDEEESDRSTQKDTEVGKHASETPSTSIENTPLPEESKSDTEVIKSTQNVKEDDSNVKKRVMGPMRPPENYVIPENYFDQESDRDLPEIMEDD